MESSRAKKTSLSTSTKFDGLTRYHQQLAIVIPPQIIEKIATASKDFLC